MHFNDIYIENNKAGILIENSFSSSKLDISVVGIGINLNQKEFSADLPNPTSLTIENEPSFWCENCFGRVLELFNERYIQAKSGEVIAYRFGVFEQIIQERYLLHLPRK